jgi:asparagine synthase (glutamine-hydrolysing)
MRVRALAGRLAPPGAGDSGWRDRLEAALRVDGAAASLASGPLELAWVGDGPEPTHDGIVCLVDGRPRTAALATVLGADPQAPPAQLIARGFASLGEAVLERVGGEFALLVWDGSARRGLLARDRVGGRPLFVAEHGRALLFASEVRNLLALLPRRPAPDGVALSHFLARTSGRHDRTLYDGIRRVPAGHAVLLSQNGWARVRHSRPAYAPPRRLPADEAALELRAALRGAVERALEGAERPAVMLSGGFDSSSIAATARAVLGDGAPPTYSTVFPEDEAVDESARIARARERIGVPGVEAAFLGGSALAAGIEFIREWELPSVTPNLFIWLPLFRRAASDGIDVLLDGEGGDELFGCAAFLVADQLRAGRPDRALRTARRLPGMGDSPPARRLRRALVRYGLRPALPYRLHDLLRRPRRGALLPEWLTDDARREQRTGDDPWAWKRNPGPRWWAKLVDAVTDGPEALGAPDQLRREAVLAGVELRHPLRDAALQDVILSLPPELAFDPHLDRALARRALAGALPPEILEDDSKPVFNSILTAALAGRDRDAVAALLADPHPELARRARAEALAGLRRGPSHTARPHAWAVDAWRLVSIGLWLEHQADSEALRRVEAALDRAPAVSFSGNAFGG